MLWFWNRLFHLFRSRVPGGGAISSLNIQSSDTSALHGHRNARTRDSDGWLLVIREEMGYIWAYGCNGWNGIMVVNKVMSETSYKLDEIFN